ncbi:MAG: rRNA pseudouridine synthase [Sphingobacteriaceae bacterium]|nr:rRNA pseudouridine synthase [Sphingobacteriaceae bacterium]
MIDLKKVEINKHIINDNVFVNETDEVKVENQIIQRGFKYVYIRFHKPKGYQSTLNLKVNDNIHSFFKDFENLAIAGRLDKDSEGLLLLSNNGEFIRNITNPDSNKEKEYLVELDQELDQNFKAKFETGISIKNYVTKPCRCEIIGLQKIKVILTEGKNRQIRKMCKALGYNVLRLQRVRIEEFTLGDLKEGEMEF